jgi:elongator complex protein 2
VKFFPGSSKESQILLTGSVDQNIRIWQSEASSTLGFRCVLTQKAHESSINFIAVAQGSDIVVSGSADATAKIWKLSLEPNIAISLLQTILLKPRYFPLALALSTLPSKCEPPALILAVGGTQSTVQIYVTSGSRDSLPRFELKATLAGHEGWIRSLAFRFESSNPRSDLLLASASQDKYIRIWRVKIGGQEVTSNQDGLNVPLGATITGKAHRFKDSTTEYLVSFEALLLGHEDWIYTAYWSSSTIRLQLLSASADTSLAIWEPDPDSGVWVCVTRLGGISAQKGSTSATGSTGGFWMGLWSPTGSEVVSLGRAGSWRLWKSDELAEEWVQQHGVTGHVGSVTGIAWESKGEYLLSTSSDQTTRLHAVWRTNDRFSWHELARPQIHGYDLNCIDVLGPLQFISGADEKLLRVFNQPRATADLLANLSGLKTSRPAELPDAANMPVLGLSNKAIEIVDDDIPIIKNGRTNKFDEDTTSTQIHRSDITFDRPPTEDQLARHTLWPELEKLYGHGYEISAVASSHDHSLVATACKSSSIDHAVIRLYETTEWHEIKPSLAAHSLTVTSLCFSGDDKMLLSVGRDRQWSVFRRDDEDKKNYKLSASNPKGHSRMILDASWAPMVVGSVFATAGRDKSVKVWSNSLENDTFVCKTTIPVSSPITAIEFFPRAIRGGTILLAVGEESGAISLHNIARDTLISARALSFRQEICPSKAITKVSWRPNVIDSNLEGGGEYGVTCETKDESYELAVASEDCSLRILRVSSLLP